MKSLYTALIFSLLFLAPMARADGPDDQYVSIYNLIQQGDTLAEKGHAASAMARYAEAQGVLKRFQSNYPDWNVKVVKYRLKYLQGKITQLSSQPKTVAPPTNPPSAAPAKILPAVPGAVPVPESTVLPEKPTPPSPSADAENQIKGLQAQLREMGTDKSLLEAKLKEALSAQPAALDPQELAKAQEQIKGLQKENELLKAGLAQAKTNSVPAVAANFDKAQPSLAEASRKVAQLLEANATLVLEKEVLQTRVKNMTAADLANAALRDENEILKKQVVELKGRGVAASPSGDMDRKLQEAQAQLAVLQSDKQILRLEKIALENRVKQFAAAPVVAIVTNAVVHNDSFPTNLLDSVTAGKIAQLEAQRDELQKSLNATTKEIYGRKKGKETAARIDEMTRQLAALRARIEVFEAHPIPYTEEELALLSKPGVTLMASAHISARKPAKELPPSAAVLLSEAKRYFLAHELDKAEAKYLEVLKLDDKNVATLADLASIQLESGRAAEAEKNLQAALAVEPNDDYSLYVLGQLKFQQKKYDEAFDALSRAAQLNPQNARVQNLLGLTLSEKGSRGPAETAFRKAIQFDPGFADAHINLAVVYITQQPPLVELARWHYQKALATGHAPNPGLERLLDPTKAATTTH